MLSEDIKSRIESQMMLDEEVECLEEGADDNSMVKIWKDHKKAHGAAVDASNKYEKFVHAYLPSDHEIPDKHGVMGPVTAERLRTDDDPKLHSKIMDHINMHGKPLTDSSRREMIKHANDTHGANTEVANVIKRHDNHPRFAESVKNTLSHGVFGRKGTPLSSALSDKREASRMDMERHSELDKTDPETHSIRKKNKLNFGAAKAAKVKAASEPQDGLLARAVKGIGGAVKNAMLDTIRAPKTTPRRTK
jgi:hypothetical protein